MCVVIDVSSQVPRKENKIIMHDLDVPTSNSVEGFNRNFFDPDRQFYSKTLIFQVIKIQKIGKIFTINNSI